MSKILVICESYPSLDNLYAMSFVHSRNIEYIHQGEDVTVLSFSAKNDYVFDGVKVRSYNSFKYIDISNYDSVVSHAPNLRNHFKYLFVRMNKIKNLIFIFHGHEILNINKYYPEDYSWERKPFFVRRVLQSCYDYLKLRVLRVFINFYSDRIKLIFVSEWMKTNGLLCLGSVQTPKQFVVNNALNRNFLLNDFSQFCEKVGDFVSIRPLNGSKYAVDLIVQFAKNNPNYNFTIYGKGDYFKYNSIPDNVKYIDSFISQDNIPHLLNKYKYAIMPTRLDAQGVMMCEIAAYGMPIIVSDLPVCREMLDGFSNCFFIENEQFKSFKINDDILNSLINLDRDKYIDKFSSSILSSKEIHIFDMS